MNTPEATNDEPDCGLHARLCVGDPDAFTDIYQRFSRVVYRASFRILRDHSLAEDVSQEVFLRFWLKPHSYAADRGSLAAWLTVAARNRSLDLLRTSRRLEPMETASEPAGKSSLDHSSECFEILASLTAAPYNDRVRSMLSVRLAQ